MDSHSFMHNIWARNKPSPPHNFLPWAYSLRQMTGGEALDVLVHDRWRGCEGIKSSGNGYRRISASTISNQLSWLTVMFPSLLEMEIGNSFFRGCGRVVIASIIWRSPRISRYFDALEEEFRVAILRRERSYEELHLEIFPLFFFYFISYVLVHHGCALVHF
jgi:hypothetical protein